MFRKKTDVIIVRYIEHNGEERHRSCRLLSPTLIEEGRLVSEWYRTNTSPSKEDAKKYSDREKSKIKTKNERDGVRHKQYKLHAVVCFDLENVVWLPRANIKSFFSDANCLSTVSVSV